VTARFSVAFVAALGIAMSTLAACDPPSPKIRMFFSQGPAQSCDTDDCAMIPVTCDFYAGIRIVDPAEPSQPLYTHCQLLSPGRTPTACMLNQITLDDLQSLPYRDLQVQVAMFPEDQVDTTTDPGIPICPSDTMYDGTGLAISRGLGEPQGPSIAGQGYYHPGDTDIDVTLGCADTGPLVDDCSFISSVQARATVDDFDTHVSVAAIADGIRCTLQAPANCLTVGIGEPSFVFPDYFLALSGLTTLTRVVPDPGSPTWAASVDHLFSAKACISVNDGIGESTTTATCTSEVSPTIPIGPTTKSLTLVGKRLSKASLDQILAAAGLTAPPPEGLTIGIVLDRGSPISGQNVVIDGPVPDGGTATIEYLNSTRTGISGSSTSSGPNGAVFISRDAPFGTTFRAMKMSTVAKQIGGRIRDKVTIVVLDVGITSTGSM
jgi:hypothetical protein